MLERFIDAWKKRRILVYLAGADAVGFVMQMLSCELGLDHALIGGIETEVEYLRLPVIDPDDGVVMDSHGFSLWLA